MVPWWGLLAAGVALLLAGPRPASAGRLLTGCGLALSGLVGVGFGLRSLLRPRLRIEKDAVWVQLGRRPIRVPIDLVECFFLGQGPSGLPAGKGGEGLEASNVIVRLAEAATDWHQRDVNPSLGHWCEGYITLRGAWCEPISLELVNRLNHQLAETKRSRRPKPP